MTRSKKTRTGRWSSLLAHGEGSSGIYDEVLDLVRHQAGPPLRGPADEILGSSDQAIAALGTLRGSESVHGFLATITPVIALAYRKLSMFPESIDHRSMIALLSLVSISETVGADVGRPTFDVTRTFDELAANQNFSDEDRVTVALLALDRGHSEYVSRLFLRNTVRGDPAALLHPMAATAAARSSTTDSALESAWETFLRDFPALLAAREAEWRHLLLAARFVMTTTGKIPVGQVADTLHRRVVELAAAE